MEQIGQLIKSRFGKGRMTHLPSCKSSEQRVAALANYKTIEDFSLANTPDMQLTLCNDTDRCYFGSYPTLGDLDKCYGRNASSYWLVPELTNLSEFCGCKEKLTGNSLKECAVIIAQQYHYLKTSEMMLFFYKFKAGEYGRFYGSVDPLVIMQALKEFIRDRYTAYEHRESELRKKQYEESIKNSISYEEYQKRLKAV